MIKDRLEQLRNLMKAQGINAYIIPTNDYHGSEYVSDFFKTREYMSGFTGSAGTLVVTLKEAGLWTDGRYFLQAGDQLKGSTIDLYKMGEPGVPTIVEFLYDKLNNNDTLGFDGKCLSTAFILNILRFLADKNLNLKFEEDLVDKVWTDRPVLKSKPCYSLDIKYTGKSRVDKIKDLRAALVRNHADSTVITSLDDINWLLNIRGDDVDCNPVILSYVIVTLDKFDLYVMLDAVSPELKAELTKDGVTLHEYFDVYEDIKKLDSKVCLLEFNKVNYALYGLIKPSIKKVNMMNLTTLPKARKNEVELKNIYYAHVKDGVAMCKFLYWLKHNVGKERMTECSIAKKLLGFRAEQENFKGVSFDTIAGYDYHGAIVHYDQTPETDIEVFPKSLILIDSGGQYLEGTTDITRTVALGPVTKEQKLHYTLVLKGHLALGNAKFAHGCSGAYIDILAREPLFEYGLDFNHGTGHGVGCFLNVHEGPQNISRSITRSSCPMLPGMVTSDEPGLYITDKYGIRIENLMACVPYMENYGTEFYQFDTLTLAPYDIDAIDKSILTDDEKKLIHNYHLRIYNTLHEYLPEEVNSWLKEIIEAI